MKQPLLIFALLIMQANGIAQGIGINPTPRIAVTGNASTRATADVIYGWLSIYSLAAEYADGRDYDYKSFQKKQLEIIERIGVKNSLINISYVSLQSGGNQGPFQVKFSNKADFEAAQTKAMMECNENFSVNLEFGSADISTEKRKALEAQMMDEAIVDAKSKAERMAKNLGVVLGKAIYVEEVHNDYNPEMAMMAYEMDSGFNGNDMTVLITAQIQIQFELK
jgi:hypothetical protein